MAGAHKGEGGGQCGGSLLPPEGEPPCLPTCRRVGTIGDEHARRSTSVCDSPSHQAEAKAWVYAATGQAGVFRAFPGPREQAAR